MGDAGGPTTNSKLVIAKELDYGQEIRPQEEALLDCSSP